MVEKNFNFRHQSTKIFRSDDGSGEILFSGQITNAAFRSGWKIQKKTCSRSSASKKLKTQEFSEFLLNN